MASVVLRVFGGMVPRRGEQHLEVVSATEAENTRLYSGELRPLIKPALAHTFAEPSDPEFNAPDPDPDPEPPVETPGLGYDPDAYCDAILALNPTGYWKFDDANGSLTIADSSGNANHLNVYGPEQQGEHAPFIDDNRTAWYSGSSLVTSPSVPPERIGLNSDELVPEGGASWWVIAGPPWYYNNLMRIDLSNDTFFRVFLDIVAGKVQIRLHTPETPSNGGVGKVYTLGQIPDYELNSTMVVGVNFNSTFSKVTGWLNFVQQPTITITEALNITNGEKIFSFAEYGNVKMQHGFCMSRELNAGDVAELAYGYERNFLSYVIPPA